LPLSMQGRVPVATWAPSASRSGSEGFIEDLSQLYNLDPTLADPFTAALTLQEQAMDMDGTGNRSRRGLAQFQQLFSATERPHRCPYRVARVFRLGYARGTRLGRWHA